MPGKFWIILLVFFCLSVSHGAPAALTYQGRILKQDGTPLEAPNVAFEFTITNPSGSCILYREQLSGVDMRNSKGVFDSPIGTGSKFFPLTAGFNILDSFANVGTLNCEGGATYGPGVDDGRKLRVQFFDGASWRLITPDNVIRSVPYAGFAANALKISGKEVGDLVLKTGIPTCASGHVLTSAASGILTCTPDAGGAAGVVNGIVGSAPIGAVDNGSGIYTISASVGTAAGTLAAGDDARIVNAIQSGAVAGGDLTGTFPSPTIAASAVTTVKVNDAAITSAKIADSSVTTAKIVDGTITPADLAAGGAAGQVLRYSGSAWVSTKLLYTDLINSLAASPWPASCPAGQFVTWSSASDAFMCAAIGSSAITTALGYTPANQARTLTAGTGLTLDTVAGASGDLSANRTLAVNVGTGANQIPQLDGSGKLNSTVLPSSVSDSLWTSDGSGNVYRSTGNVGIGTTTPATTLDVNGSQITRGDSAGYVLLAGKYGTNPIATDFDRFQIQLDPSSPVAYLGTRNGGTGGARALTFHTANTDRMTIDASGNVGLGTTSPKETLDVRGAITATSGLRFNAYNDGAWKQSTTGYSSVIYQDNSDGSLYLSNSSASVAADATPTLSTRMTIDKAGNVGIGTTTPGAALHVYGTGSGAAPATSGSIDATMNERVCRGSVCVDTGMMDNGTGYIQNRWLTNFANNGSLAINPNGGNVGIGTTTPAYLLDVNGTAKVTQLCLGADCRSAWPGTGGGGTVTSVATGTGLTGGPITGSGTVSIATGGVSATELASNAVTTVKINDAAVTTAKINDGAVTSAKLETVAGLTAAAYGSATAVPVVTVDVKGRVTAISTSPISGLLPAASGATDKFLKSDGTSWAGSNILFSDIKNGTGATAFNTSACTANQTVKWSSLTDMFECQNIGSLNASAITVGTIDAARLPAGASMWQDGGSSKIYYSAGSVGIGTTNPQAQLHIASSTQANLTVGIEGDDAGESASLNFVTKGQGPIANAVTKGWHIAARGDQYNGTESNYLAFMSYSGTTATPVLAMSPNGFVGIGTTSPSANLEVSSSANTESRISSSGGWATLTLKPLATATNAAAQLSFSTGTSKGWNWVARTNAYSVTAEQNQLQLLRSPDALTAMSVDYATGNVGIGTTAPAANLHLYGASGVQRITATAASGFAAIDFDGDLIGGSEGSIGWGNSASGLPSQMYLGTASVAPIVFRTDSAEKMRITSSGNVGIGTTSPTEKLDVAGHARVSGSVINGGMDFVLGNSDQVSRGNSGRSRALVKDAGTTLVVNYNGDFSGGTRFDGASGSPNFFVSGAANGNVGIGITNPTYKLQVNGQPAANGFTAFTNYSDRRLKTDIHPIEDNVLEKVLALNPSQFSYNNKYYDLTGYEKSEQSQQMKGFVAQELQEVFPDMVHEKEVGGETYLDTNLSSLQIYLVKAFREFYDKFTRTTETHSREIASMKAENAQLKVNDAAKDDKIKRLEQESAAKAKEMSELKAYLCAKDPKAPICK